MTEVFIIKLFINAKDMLVYFNDYNRHLYRYNGFEILIKLFLKHIKNSELLQYFNILCLLNLHKICKLFLENTNIVPMDSLFGDMCRYNRVEIVALLLKNGKCNPGYLQNYPIRSACDNGCLQVVDLLLNDPRIDATDREYYCFRKSSANGHTEILKCLLKKTKIPPDVIDKCIFDACYYNHKDTIGVLLQYPFENLNKSTRYLLKTGKMDLFYFLIDYNKIK